MSESPNPLINIFWQPDQSIFFPSSKMHRTFDTVDLQSFNMLRGLLHSKKIKILEEDTNLIHFKGKTSDLLGWRGGISSYSIRCLIKWDKTLKVQIWFPRIKIYYWILCVFLLVVTAVSISKNNFLVIVISMILILTWPSSMMLPMKSSLKKYFEKKRWELELCKKKTRTPISTWVKEFFDEFRLNKRDS